MLLNRLGSCDVIGHVTIRPTMGGFIHMQWNCAGVLLRNYSLTESLTYGVSQKNPPCGFLKFFPKRLGIFNQFFTHLLYGHFYTRVQIFIQIFPTLTKLCHTKRNHLAKFYISLEL